MMYLSKNTITKSLFTLHRLFTVSTEIVYMIDDVFKSTLIVLDSYVKQMCMHISSFQLVDVLEMKGYFLERKGSQAEYEFGETEMTLNVVKTTIYFFTVTCRQFTVR